MGAIELKMALLSGLVGGVIMVLAEGVALHRRLSRYRAHLRELYQAKRLLRLCAEISGMALVVLIQPVIVSLLMMKTLDGFTPQFSVHAIAQLRHEIFGDHLK